VNSVLERILETQQVSDGIRNLPLSHPDFPNLPVAVTEAEGALIQRVIADIKPTTSLEIGCAYGVSTLYICETLASLLDAPRRHIVLDPFQSTQWRGIGVRNVRDAGFVELLDFKEQRSELALPELLRDGVTIQLALVDGWHTFDQVMVEFYYLNRMLEVGGVILFDDADRRSVNRVIRHALTYPAHASMPAPSRVADTPLDARAAPAGAGVRLGCRHHRAGGRAASRLGSRNPRIVRRRSRKSTTTCGRVAGTVRSDLHGGANGLRGCCLERWSAIMAPHTGSLKQELILELSEYFGISVAAVEAELADATERFTEEWRAQVTDPSMSVLSRVLQRVEDGALRPGAMARRGLNSRGR
jgi:predicted O-methyltransferase YrrM